MVSTSSANPRIAKGSASSSYCENGEIKTRTCLLNYFVWTVSDILSIFIKSNNNGSNLNFKVALDDTYSSGYTNNIT